MRRNLALAIVLAVAAALTGCATTDNANSRANTNNTNNPGNPPREGLVETNANIPANTNSRTVSSNTGVVTNDNGNANTDGIKSVNHNANKRH